MNQDRNEQTTEVRETDTQQEGMNIRRQTVETSTKADTGVVLRRVVYYLTGVIVVLLGLRVVLLLLAANQGSAFVDFVYAISGFFASPFYGVFSYTPAYGQSVFEISTLVGIIVYALVGMGLGKLFTLARHDTV